MLMPVAQPQSAVFDNDESVASPSFETGLSDKLKAGVRTQIRSLADLSTGQMSQLSPAISAGPSTLLYAFQSHTTYQTRTVPWNMLPVANLAAVLGSYRG